MSQICFTAAPHEPIKLIQPNVKTTHAVFLHTVAVGRLRLFCKLHGLLFCTSCIICHCPEESSAFAGCACLSV